jgi:4-carboxymuconolactone decarboxylase
MTDLATGPRVAPLEPPYEPAIGAMLSKWMPAGSTIEPLALFRTLAIHDELFARMRPLGAGILGHGRIEPREREIVIHRTCARAGAEYEWGVHVVAYGKPLGLTDAQIAASVSGSAEDPAWSESDRLLVRLADELHDTGTVGSSLWSALARRYAHDQLLELVIIAGWYRLLSSVINAVGIPLELWAARFPSDGLLIEDQLVGGPGEEQREEGPGHRPAEREQERPPMLPGQHHEPEDADQHDGVEDDRDDGRGGQTNDRGNDQPEHDPSADGQEVDREARALTTDDRDEARRADQRRDHEHAELPVGAKAEDRSHELAAAPEQQRVE